MLIIEILIAIFIVIYIYLKRHVPPISCSLFSCRFLVPSCVNVIVIHPSKAAVAYHAIDTIDRLWSHEHSNLGYGTRFSIVIVSWKVTSTWLILARGQSAVVFLLSEKAHLFEVLEKLSRSFSEN